jgi:hypothetical protein
MNIAVIENGMVENIIVCDSVELAEEITGKECVEYTDQNPAFIGFGWDGTTFEQPLDDEPTEPEAENGNS